MKFKFRLPLYVEIEAESKEDVLNQIKQLDNSLYNKKHKVVMNIFTQPKSKYMDSSIVDIFRKAIFSNILEVKSMETVGLHSIKTSKRNPVYYESPTYGKLTHYFINTERIKPGDIILAYELQNDILKFYQKMTLDTDTWITFNYTNSERQTYSDKSVLQLIESSNNLTNKFERFISLNFFSDKDLKWIINNVPYSQPYKFIGISKQRTERL